MNKKIKIDSKYHYLSQVINRLPSNCLLNKGITGCGGTTVEIESSRNSIILVPNINLVKNKMSQYPNIIGVYGDIDSKEIKKRVDNTKGYIKVISTYDGLERLTTIIDDIYSYFLLIDEYHILFNSYSFRYKAINYILTNYMKFKEFCFMTATPLNSFNILEELKDLDTITYEWPQSIQVKINLIDTYFTSREVCKVIQQEDKCNLHIFINSLNTIRSIIKQSKIQDYRTICSDQARINDKKNGGILHVKDINTDPCKINFYTATAFEGVDLIDPIGKTIIVSDSNISQSLLDISTLFIQICGRLRNSVYKDTITYICNTHNHRYIKYKTKKEFISFSDNLSLLAIKAQNEWSKTSEDVQNMQYEIYIDSPDTFHSRYLSGSNNSLIYNPNLKKVDIQNYDIVSRVFSSEFSVLKELSHKTESKVEVQNKEFLIKLFNTLPSLTVSYLELKNCIQKIYKGTLFKNINDNMISGILSTISQYYTKEHPRTSSGRTYIYNFTKLKQIQQYL